MSNKKDSTNLQFFNESVLERMQIEINRVTQLYKADRIGGIRGHEMLHSASEDINKLFWQVSAMIGQEHNKIDYLHKVKKAMQHPLEDQKYFSKPTIEALDSLVTVSKFYRAGISPFSALRKAGILARKLVRIDCHVLRQDISDLLYKAKRFTPPEPEGEPHPDEMYPDVSFEDMEVKKVSQASNKHV